MPLQRHSSPAMRYCLPLLAIGIVITISQAQSPVTPASPAADESKWEKLVKSLLPPHVGACVLVVDQGETVVELSEGVTDLRTRTRCTPATNFRLASISKQFTAASILLLADRQALSLDQTLDRFFPGFPAYGKKVTVRHLLTHTSGLPDYEPLVPDGTTLQLRDLDVLDLLMDVDTPRFPAGARFAYSNSGYVLLGLIVEIAADQPFHQFMAEEIFAPIGMDRTVLFVKGINQVPDRAYGHVSQAGQWQEADQSVTSAVRGDGGIYSSLRDLRRWLRALDRLELLSHDAYGSMFTPSVATDRGDAQYGYGWFIDRHHGQLRISHEGETRGFALALHRYPERQAAVVILLNNEVDEDTRDVCARIADAVLFADEQPSRTPRP